jgi:benzylsuccinate CoA-transferase BbsE subunit
VSRPPATPPRALDGLRVIDLSGPTGNYCGKLLAELGADVVLVEPPGGTELRGRAPFVPGLDGEPASAAFLYLNTGKRSVCADLQRDDDLPFLRALLSGADLVIETTAPGTLDARGLGWATLAEHNPGLVMTSVTPFGQSGPWSGYAGSDLVCLALGGLLSLTGYGDGAPMQICGEQSHVMANTYAAVASMIALLHAEATGEGQQIDVSVQACVATALENAPQFYDLEGTVRGRPNGTQRHAGTGIYGCRDGYVYLYVGGIASGRFWDRLVSWLSEAGIDGAAELGGERWADRSFLETDEAKEHFAGVFDTLAEGLTKAELYAQAQGRGIPLCPVNGVEDLVASEQLDARGFFAAVTGADGSEHRWPGAPYQLSLTPWQLGGPAPRLGEHDDEVRAALAAGERS